MGKAIRKSKELVPDFEHLSKVFRYHHVNLSKRSLRKLWEVAQNRHPLSPETRNRLALLAGFQSWDDLQDTLHGETDASVNYGNEENKKRKDPVVDSSFFISYAMTIRWKAI